MSEDFRPVVINDGSRMTAIASTLQALEFMDEWPRDRRGPAFLTAYRCLLRALYREVEDETASRAFQVWARSVAILVPEVEAHIAAEDLASRAGKGSRLRS